jgi:thiol-disulfide isomerase/thioredoxin
MFHYEPSGQWSRRTRLPEQTPQAAKKKSSSTLRILLVALAIIAASSLAYHFWPALKDAWPTAKAAVLTSRDVPLTGIFFSEDNPMAIVDGKIVHEGDMIGPVKVLEIQKDIVAFQSPDRTWIQSVPAAEAGVGSALPVLLQLGSYGCPPCRQMTPILDELRADYAKKFQVRYIDVWKYPMEGRKYGVTKIPTQIFYDTQGRELYRHVGFLSKKEILNTWKKLGVNP